MRDDSIKDFIEGILYPDSAKTMSAEEYKYRKNRQKKKKRIKNIIFLILAIIIVIAELIYGKSATKVAQDTIAKGTGSTVETSESLQP